MTVQEIITDQIIKMLESGLIPWDKPFSGMSPRNIRGTGYRGINLLILGSQGFRSPFWVTFNQVRGLGGKIIKGSHATKIVFWKWVNRDPDYDPDLTPVPGTEGEKFPILRYYNVFNLDQTEGIPEDKIPSVPGSGPGIDPISGIESWIEKIPGLEIKYSSEDKACYSPSGDYIQIPGPEYFTSPEGYYQTHFHEIGHWSGHQDRLNRDLTGHFGTESYSFEELIAELFSAFQCGHFGIEKSVIRNNVAYIQSWIKVLKNDPKMIIKACSQSQKIQDYLFKLTGTESGSESGETEDPDLSPETVKVA